MTLPPHFFSLSLTPFEQKKKIHDETKKILFFFPTVHTEQKKVLQEKKILQPVIIFWRK